MPSIEAIERLNGKGMLLKTGIGRDKAVAAEAKTKTGGVERETLLVLTTVSGREQRTACRFP